MTEVKKNLAPENQKDRKEGFVKVNMMKAGIFDNKLQIKFLNLDSISQGLRELRKLPTSIRKVSLR